METKSKAEQLLLPEQLYLLLTDPGTGEPRLDRERVKQVLATAVLWELLHSGMVSAQGDEIVAVNEVLSPTPYLRNAAYLASHRVPISAHRLVLEIAAELHPLWHAVGEAMVAEHLLQAEVRQRFLVFHQRVLTELGAARQDGLELTAGLRQAAQRVWDPQYEAQLAETHPRLLARLILLDNFHLLSPLLGSTGYATLSQHLPELREHVKQRFREAPAGATGAEDLEALASRRGSGSTGWGDSGGGIYDSGSTFWVDHDDAHDHGGHAGHGHDGHGHDGHDGHDGGDGHGDGDGGGSDGGGGGGDGGCGGCGGCGG